MKILIITKYWCKEVEFNGKISDEELINLSKKTSKIIGLPEAIVGDIK